MPGAKDTRADERVPPGRPDGRHHGRTDRRPAAEPASDAGTDADAGADPNGPAPAPGSGPGPDPVAAALRAAMDRLARRGWGRGELVAALERAGFDPDDATAAVETCVDRGWLDEGQAARDRARRLRRRGPVAPATVEADLLRRDVDPATAARVAAETVPDPVADAAAAVRRGLRGRDPADVTMRERLRIAARLARRGFDEDTVRSALDRAGVPLADVWEG